MMMMKMASRVVLLVVAVACVIQGSWANQLPVARKFILDSALINKAPAVLVTTAVPMTTPSMVDFESGNFTYPSDIAGDCLKAIGDSLVTKCQNKATSDWDPARVNTSTSTTWETCCALFDELDCYVQNANDYCPEVSRKAVIMYSKKVAFYFHYAICSSVSFDHWQDSCDNAAHAAQVQNHTKSLDDNPGQKPEFTQLPKDDGPETACFNKLRTSTSVDLEMKCQNASLNKWDPARRKLLESGITESCCSIYDTMDCVQRKAKSTCTDTELADMNNYRKKALVVFAAGTCKNVPYAQYGKLCAGGGSYAVLPSLATLVTALLVYLRVGTC